MEGTNLRPDGASEKTMGTAVGVDGVVGSGRVDTIASATTVATTAATVNDVNAVII